MKETKEYRQKFTLKERDIETGLDFFEARYYASTQGRFTGPDSYNIIIEKEKGKDETERNQIFLKYIEQPQVWNKYAYTLNDPLKYTDPDGRRALNEQDWRRLELLSREYDKAEAANNTDLTNAIGKAMNEIAWAIDAVPEGQQDPANLRAVGAAIDSLGRRDYDNSSAGVNDGTTYNTGPNTNKCSSFVAHVFAVDLGLGFDGGGVPTHTASLIGAIAGRRYPPTANMWANADEPIANFSNGSANSKLGDVAAWGERGGQGHVGIYIGGGTIISASQFFGVRPASVSTVNSAHDSAAVFRSVKR